MNQDDLSECLDPDAKSALDHLESRLQVRLGGRVRDFRLHLQGDGVVLRGFARTYHAKQLAQHAVMAETQVPILANEIEVC